MDGGGYLITIWVVYGLASIGLTFFLARTLYRNGAVFLEALFPQDADLAKAVNVLLVVEFYMLNLGYAALLLSSEQVARVHSGVDGAGLLVNRLGVLLVSLGVIHFLNMTVFYKLGRRGALKPAAAFGGAGQRGPAPDITPPPRF